MILLGKISISNLGLLWYLDNLDDTLITPSLRTLSVLPNSKLKSTSSCAAVTRIVVLISPNLAAVGLSLGR